MAWSIQILANIRKKCELSLIQMFVISRTKAVTARQRWLHGSVHKSCSGQMPKQGNKWLQALAQVQLSLITVSAQGCTWWHSYLTLAFTSPFLSPFSRSFQLILFPLFSVMLSLVKAACLGLVTAGAKGVADSGRGWAQPRICLVIDVPVLLDGS